MVTNASARAHRFIRRASTNPYLDFISSLKLSPSALQILENQIWSASQPAQSKFWMQLVKIYHDSDEATPKTYYRLVEKTRDAMSRPDRLRELDGLIRQLAELNPSGAEVYSSALAEFYEELASIAVKTEKTLAADRIQYGRWGDPQDTKYYIRFGKWPANFRSKIQLDEEWQEEVGTREGGLSVYAAYPYKGGWQLQEPEPKLYRSSFDVTFLAPAINSGDIFLVTGPRAKGFEVIRDRDDPDPIRRPITGVDGEPLLARVDHAIKLKPSQIYLHDTTLEEYLQDYKHPLLSGFRHPEGPLREIALGEPLLGDKLESGDLPEEEENTLRSLLEIPIEDLTEAQQWILLAAIKKLRSEKNSYLVKRKYRPFV